jgi:thiol:disulfide interchange protein
MVTHRVILIGSLALAWLIAIPTFGQNKPLPNTYSNPPLASAKQKTETQAPYEVTGRYHLQQDSNEGYLILQFDLPKGSYIYSLTQSGELLPSKIAVTRSEDFVTRGKFIPDSPPKVVEKDPVFNQRVEKHVGKIQFFVPIQVEEGINLSELRPEMVFNGQVCSNQGICIPIRKKKVVAEFAGYFQRTAQKRSNSQTGQIK